MERSLPFVAILLVLLLALSYANLLGYPTEIVTRAGVISGLVVAILGFAILLARQRELPPQDYQRLRWVIWGCLIGLPALVFADAGTTTTLLNFLWPNYSPPEQLWGLLYLINGVLCLLVTEALRKPYVVTVSIPLRRVTILGLLLSLPILFLHEGIDHIREGISEKVTLPAWAWIGIAAIILFLTSKLHDTAVHYLDWLFNRSIAKAGGRLGDAVLRQRALPKLKRSSSRGCITPLGLPQRASFVSRTKFSSAPPRIIHGMTQRGHSIQTIRCSNLHTLVGHMMLTPLLPPAITFLAARPGRSSPFQWGTSCVA